MRIWFSFITVSLFLGSIFQPVFPIYNYFLNYDYIVNVLCVNKDKPEMHCDGKCYLKKEISKSNNLDKGSKKALANYQFKPIPVYFETTSEFNPVYYQEDFSENAFCKVNFFENISIAPNLPPPRI